MPLDPRATVATGFIAAGPWDFVGHVELREGTVDKDIARSNDRDDMVASTMSTFCSLTVHCARCHDHKFDPIRQADYYALQAVFAGVERADRPYDVDAPTAARRAALVAERERLASKLAAIEKCIARITSPEIAALDASADELAKELAALPPDKPGQTLGYHSQIMPTAEAVKWVQVDLGESETIDEIVLVPAHVVYGGHPGPGFGFPPRFTVEVSDAPDFSDARVLADHRSEPTFRTPATHRCRSPPTACGLATCASLPRGCGSGRTTGSSRWPKWPFARAARTWRSARPSPRSIRSRPHPPGP